MDNWEAATKASATRLGVTLKVKKLEAIMVFISGSDVFVTLLTGNGSPWCLAFYNGSLIKLKGRQCTKKIERIATCIWHCGSVKSAFWSGCLASSLVTQLINYQISGSSLNKSYTYSWPDPSFL